MTALAPQGRYPSGMAPVTGTGVGVAMLLIKGLGLLGRSVNIASVSRPQEIGPLNHGIWESQSATAPLSDSAQSETHRQNDGKARNAEKRPHPTNVFGLVRPGQYPLPPPFADPTQPTAPPTPAPASRTVSMLEACDTAHQPLAPPGAPIAPRGSKTGHGAVIHHRAAPHRHRAAGSKGQPKRTKTPALLVRAQGFVGPWGCGEISAVAAGAELGMRRVDGGGWIELGFRPVARIPPLKPKAGLAVVIAEHRAGKAEIGDRQQQQLPLAAHIAALVDDPARGEGDAAAPEPHRFRAHLNLRLPLQHNEDRLVSMAVFLIACAGRDANQARIQGLQTLEGKALHQEVEAQAAVVVLVVNRQGGGGLAGAGGAAGVRGGWWWLASRGWWQGAGKRVGGCGCRPPARWELWWGSWGECGGIMQDRAVTWGRHCGCWARWCSHDQKEQRRARVSASPWPDQAGPAP